MTCSDCHLLLFSCLFVHTPLPLPILPPTETMHFPCFKVKASKHPHASQSAVCIFQQYISKVINRSRSRLAPWSFLALQATTAVRSAFRRSGRPIAYCIFPIRLSSVPQVHTMYLSDSASQHDTRPTSPADDNCIAISPLILSRAPRKP
jgi:hypothetical protein